MQPNNRRPPVSIPETLRIKKITRRRGCRCKKNECLNGFCGCFSNGTACQDCSCLNCNNSEEYQEISKVLKTDIFCTCPNSKCIQKYCACFKTGNACSAACSCVHCHNSKTGEDFFVPKSDEKSKESYDKNTIDWLGEELFRYNESSVSSGNILRDLEEDSLNFFLKRL